MSQNKDTQILNVAFYPWFALGHLTSFLRLANKLAERGHKVSYFIPPKTRSKLASHNHYPTHLTFIPIPVPPVEGLPPGAETTNDVPASSGPLIMNAMDMTRDTIETHLVRLKPDIVFYDFTCWMPELARKHGFKAIHYITAYIARYAYLAPYKKIPGYHPNANDLLTPPPEFPSQSIRMLPQEAEIMAGAGKTPFGLGGLTLAERLGVSFRECDAFGVKTCTEMEGEYCKFFEKIFGKPVLLAGPMVPKTPSSKLDKYFDDWLNSFGNASVIYCALGSECALKLNQFQELVLGLELTGRPFLAALKPPMNYQTIESALPEGFAERTKSRGLIHGGWVQQQLIVQHPSVGCFITHCGAGSLSEAMVSECQVVLMPQAIDQFISARMMSLEWKVGVEVEKRKNDGLFTKEAVHKAVSLVMEEDSEVGRDVRANHAKWREFILTEGLEDSYISSFIMSLQQLIGS
ncbi:UDP-glycosyltransferase 79B30-like [Chenopodium quinoa]|uniref:Glycosyltransferase n=1 Tax=Chenopodium quinoa TaxID=63459 RepID=A0A803LQI9_CHEQI|nr:UDP-glycosyltransferase 79B30-like [Chenopodium quinoa]